MKKKLIYNSLLLTIFILVFNGCAIVAPLPSTFNIVPPSSDIPAEIAAFSGVWEGRWNGWNDTILVVERIDNETAEVILSFSQNQDLIGAYSYVTATVRPGPSIEWTIPEGYTFIFQIDKGLNKINGFQIEKSTGSKQRCYLTRRESK